MHNIEYFTYPENVDKDRVEAQLDDYVAHEDWQEGCCGLYHAIRWLKDKTYGNSEEAHKAINDLDRGDYDNLAVRYFVHHKTNDAKEKTLSDKLNETFKEYDKRSKILYAEQVTSAYIGCKECGSKLARTRLKSNHCPVCQAELRPEHMMKSVQSAKNRWDKASREYKAYIDKKGKKEVMWLVKIEYHT